MICTDAQRLHRALSIITRRNVFTLAREGKTCESEDPRVCVISKKIEKKNALPRSIKRHIVNGSCGSKNRFLLGCYTRNVSGMIMKCFSPSFSDSVKLHKALRVVVVFGCKR